MRKIQTKLILVELHAEATPEKLAMGRMLDGQGSAVWGTHTHVPTADTMILPQGTGYVTDLGMTGPRDSVLGIRPELSIRRFSYFFRILAKKKPSVLCTPGSSCSQPWAVVSLCRSSHRYGSRLSSTNGYFSVNHASLL